jgi:hypothetical protein
MQQVQSFSLLYARIYIKGTFESSSTMMSFIKTPNSVVKSYNTPHYDPIQVRGAGPKLFVFITDHHCTHSIQSVPLHSKYFRMIHWNMVTLFTSKSSKWPHSFRLTEQNFVCISSLHVTWLVNQISTNFCTLIISCEKYKLCTSSLRNYFPSSQHCTVSLRFSPTFHAQSKQWLDINIIQFIFIVSPCIFVCLSDFYQLMHFYCD